MLFRLPVTCFICFSMALLLHNTVRGQQSVVNGRVVNPDGAPVPSASVTLRQKTNPAILGFAFSGTDGRFEIRYNFTGNDTLELRAALIGYTTQSIPFINGQRSSFQFSLSPQAVLLPEVKAANKPIWQRKDTINYDAATFRQRQDRVIGDIIARLPGMEVTPSGEIRYQGRPINKYYIEGLDLLEDRYGIANNNIPADAVAQIQVLENHQPIRILDSVSLSNRAALNIKLNSAAKARLLGQARLGAGAAPLLTEDELVAMRFKKKAQLINTYKYNNTGMNLGAELVSQNIADYMSAMQNGAARNDLVSVIRPSTPPLLSNRYTFNSAHTLSVNQLFPLDSIYQLRVNLSYMNDYQRMESSLHNRIYLPADTILFTERNNAAFGSNLLQADLTLMANSPKFYFKNLLRIKGWWQSDKGLLQNNTAILQRATTRFFNLANDFRLIKTGKQFIREWSSYIGYASQPQQLFIYPGLYAETLNSSVPYEAIQQKASSNIFYTDNSLTLRRRKGRFNFYTRTGFSLQQKEVATSIFKLSGNEQTAAADSFFNNLTWQRIKLYTELSGSYETGLTRFTVNMPVGYTLIRYTGKPDPVVNKQGLVVNPTISMLVQLSPRWDWSNSFNWTNLNFGDAEQVMNGYILKTYRNFERNRSPLPEQASYGVSSFFTYRDPLKSVFLSTGASYTHNSNNIIYQQAYTGSLETLVAQLLDNSFRSLSFFMRTNKYIPAWKTTLSLRAGHNFGKQQQLQQGVLSDFRNSSISGGIGINTKLKDFLAADYSASGSRFTSGTVAKGNSNPIVTASQKLSINYFPGKRWIFRMAGEYFYLDQPGQTIRTYFFADMGIRFKPRKGKADWELLLNNIFNTKSFVSATNFNNSETVSTYQVRPLQVLVKMGFRL